MSEYDCSNHPVVDVVIVVSVDFLKVLQNILSNPCTDMLQISCGCSRYQIKCSYIKTIFLKHIIDSVDLSTSIFINMTQYKLFDSPFFPH